MVLVAVIIPDAQVIKREAEGFPDVEASWGGALGSLLCRLHMSWVLLQCGACSRKPGKKSECVPSPCRIWQEYDAAERFFGVLWVWVCKKPLSHSGKPQLLSMEA